MSERTRTAILRYLAAGGDARFRESYLVRGVQQQIQVTREGVWEALWGLVSNRLIFLDPGSQGPDNWHWRLTALGQRVAAGGSWEPEDPTGYLARVRKSVPNLDAQVELYLSEAVYTFAARCFLSSSVMLGVAAERAFRVMAAAYASSGATGARAMRRELDKPRANYASLWIEFRKRIENDRKSIPEGLADPLTLDAVAELLRLTRNEAGHPTGQRVDEDTARLHLTIAPIYLKKMEALTTHFEQWPPETEEGSSAT